MRPVTARALAFALAVLGLGLAGPVHAVYVNYTVADWGPMQFPGPWGRDGYPGDTVEFRGYEEGSLELTPGQSYQQISTLLWTVDYTWTEDPGGGGEEKRSQDLFFEFDATPALSFDGGPASCLQQAGVLEVTSDYDYLSFFDGSTTSFVVQGYRIDVTPLGLDRQGAYKLGDLPWEYEQEVLARFDVSAVPEPTALLTGAMVLALFGAAKFRSVRPKRTK
jgi:hypothetical protein